jgi:hypothetical protein
MYKTSKFSELWRAGSIHSYFYLDMYSFLWVLYFGRVLMKQSSGRQSNESRSLHEAGLSPLVCSRGKNACALRGLFAGAKSLLAATAFFYPGSQTAGSIPHAAIRI